MLIRLDPARRDELAGTALAVRNSGAGVDGWLRLEAAFQDRRHAEWALWQLGSRVEALSPAWLRTRLRVRAATIATQYGSAPY